MHGRVTLQNGFILRCQTLKRVKNSWLSDNRIRSIDIRHRCHAVAVMSWTIDFPFVENHIPLS